MEALELDTKLIGTQTELILLSERLSAMTFEVQNKNWFGQLMDKINDILDGMAEIVLHITDTISHPAGHKLKSIYNLINDILKKMTVLNGFRYSAGN